MRDPDAVAAVLRRRLAEDGELAMPVSGSSMGRVISSGSTVTVAASGEPRAGEIWALVDDQGLIVVHVVRHVTDDVVVARGRSNDVDDQPVPRSRLIGLVASAVDSSGARTAFGTRSRLVYRSRLRARGIAREILRILRQH